MKTRLLSLSFFVGVSLLVGCKKSSDGVTPGGCESIAPLSDKFSAAATAFSSDATNKTKCAAYVEAYRVYAEAVIACTSVYTQAQRDDIRASYTQSKDACK